MILSNNEIKKKVNTYFKENYEHDKFGEYKDILTPNSYTTYNIKVNSKTNKIENTKIFEITIEYELTEQKVQNKITTETYISYILKNSKDYENINKEIFRVSYQSRKILSEYSELNS